MNSLNNNVLEQDDTTKSTEKSCAKESCSGIYGLRNKTTGKWYVGYSKNIYKRWKAYKYLRCKKQRKIYNALTKYGYSDFETVILEKCQDDNTVWQQLETKWIEKLDSISNGYNISSGGIGGALHRSPHTEETKRKISEDHLGKTLSIEHKQNISDGLKRANRTISSFQRTRMNEGRKKVIRTVDELKSMARARCAKYRAKRRLIKGQRKSDAQQ